MSVVRSWRWALAPLALLTALPAAAERLKTVWKLEPIGDLAPRTANFGRVFLEQRLVPLRLVKLTADVTIGTLTVPAGAPLFLVHNEDQKIGFCTVKDRSFGTAARSLFIPALDKRPCFVDEDGDGRFDKTFEVFDKYGNSTTPSGSLRAVVPLSAPVGYAEADPHEYPVEMKISFALTGSHKPEKADVVEQFSSGKRYGSDFWFPLKRDGNSFIVANLRVSILQVAGDDASISLETVPDVYLTTDNPGNLIIAPLPQFLAR